MPMAMDGVSDTLDGDVSDGGRGTERGDTRGDGASAGVVSPLSYKDMIDFERPRKKSAIGVC